MSGINVHPVSGYWACVNAVQIPDLVGRMERWISNRDDTHFIAVAGMHRPSEAGGILLADVPECGRPHGAQELG